MATKKQEVADSWEEIDEDRLPGTISILKNTANNTGTTTKANARATASGHQDTLPQTLEEELRPKMVARPMQILKRPQSGTGTDGKSPTDSKPKTQIKSLDQRKQEYAEARLRILGSAHDDAHEAETKKTTPTTTSNTTNGYRINNVNNNTVAAGGGNVVAGGGVGAGGITANNNANNAYRYHSPYRQQGPIGTFSPTLQNSVPPAQTNGMYYSSMNNQNQHHPMHSTHPLHHQHNAFSHVAHHHLQHSSHPYQHQQHFAQHMNPQSGNQHLYGGRTGASVAGSSGYYCKSGPPPYTETNGAPLLGHAPPGVHQNHALSYGSGGPVVGYGQINAHGTPIGHAGTNVANVLRLPAGPDGSQGFNMRR